MDFTLDDEQQAIHDITKQVLGDLSTHSRLKDLAVADDHVDCDAWAALAEAGGGTNEMQRDLISQFGLGYPKADR